ncbi:1016_t:CDS:2, partial [Entrophospora sp. SA101]
EDYEKNNADASTSEDSDYVIKDEKYYDDDHENRNQYAADAIYNQNFMQITKEEYGNGSSNNVGITLISSDDEEVNPNDRTQVATAINAADIVMITTSINQSSAFYTIQYYN